MEKQREEFEAWCHKDDQLCTHRYPGSVEYSDDYTQFAWQAWQHAQKLAIPEGYVVVPKEPTEKMINKGDNCSIFGKVTSTMIYKAMIEAVEKNDE